MTEVKWVMIAWENEVIVSSKLCILYGEYIELVSGSLGKCLTCAIKHVMKNKFKLVADPFFDFVWR